MLVFLWFAAVFSAFYPPVAPLVREAAPTAKVEPMAPARALSL